MIMENLTKQLSVGARIAISLTHCFYYPTPTSIYQQLINRLLKKFSLLRKFLIQYAKSACAFDFYRVQSLLILKKAGFHDPNPRQINTVEQLLRVNNH